MQMICNDDDDVWSVHKALCCAFLYLLLLVYATYNGYRPKWTKFSVTSLESPPPSIQLYTMKTIPSKNLHRTRTSLSAYGFPADNTGFYICLTNSWIFLPALLMDLYVHTFPRRTGSQWSLYPVNNHFDCNILLPFPITKSWFNLNERYIALMKINS